MSGPFLVWYVVVVDLLAVGLVVAFAAAITVRADQLPATLFLVALTILYTELSRPVEKVRDRFGGTPHVDLNSVWMFAATLLLHPGLASLVIATSYLHRWLRVHRRVVHRQVFSTACTVVAAHATSGLLWLVAGRPFAEMPRDTATFALVVAAGLVFLVVDATLPAVAVALSRTPRARLGSVLAASSDHALEGATVGLGVLLAWALVDWPVAQLLVVGVTLVLHRSVLVRHLSEKVKRDGKTGLLNAAAWREAAGTELARLDRVGQVSGLLMLDVDNFKAVNDRYGHLVGDKVLCAVADTLRAEVRASDLVGRFGGDEFVVFLPDTEAEDAMAIAERIRRRIAATGVAAIVNGQHVAVSVGIAAHLGNGMGLDELLHAADMALYEAKELGRNRSALAAAPVTATAAAQPS